MAIDVEKLIADATAARANAEATALAAQKIADQNKADTEKANNVKSEAATKFDYAKALKKTIVDFEGQISAYITKISRGDKLDSTQPPDVYKSGTNLYVLLVTAVAAGSFNVTFYTTGGTATDAPVINFSIIKGVAA
jgi:hypothetical protein